MPDRSAPLVSDADQTLQLPSADQTVADHVAVSAKVAAVIAREEPVAQAAADGTQELGGADILEVQQIAEKLDAEPVVLPSKTLTEAFGALAPRRPLGTLMGIGVPRPTPRTPPVAFAPPPAAPQQPSHHPSSIAPLALDVVAEPSAQESTIHIRRAAGIPDRARPELAIAAGLAAWAMMAAAVLFVLGGAFVGIKRHAATKANAVATQLPSRAAIDALPEPPPPAVEEQTPTPAVEVAAPPVAAAISAPPVHRASTPPRTVPAAAKSTTTDGKAATAGQTGVLRVPSGVKGILVDGVPHKVDGGALFLSCGKHVIKASGQASRSVDVPCGKTIVL